MMKTSFRSSSRFCVRLRLVVFLFYAALALPAEARDWHVAPGGTGDGSSGTPAGSLQAALNAAQPDDVVRVQAGVYDEALRTVRERVTVQAEPLNSVTVRFAGKVLEVNHPHITFRGVHFNGLGGAQDAVNVRSGGAYFTLEDFSVSNTQRDCIDVYRDAHNLLIQRGSVHTCLWMANGQRQDAHAIALGAIDNAVIRDVTLADFSGDGVQIDPSRSAGGWDNLVIERCRFSLRPLPENTLGFPAGTVPGENAIDTKLNPYLGPAQRARLFVYDSTASGFRGGAIANMAAFNIKENVDATFERIKVFDSEIAFRLRGRTSNGGANVIVRNALVYASQVAFRYEDDIGGEFPDWEHRLHPLTLHNVTVGGGVQAAFLRASSPNSRFDIRNFLILGASLPLEARGSGVNLAVAGAAFTNAAGHDYHLAPDSAARDAGEVIPEITKDIESTARPKGAGYDVGAYEFDPEPASDRTSPAPPSRLRQR